MRAAFTLLTQARNHSDTHSFTATRRNLGIKMAQLKGATPSELDAVSGHNERVKDTRYGLRGLCLPVLRQNCGLVL